MNKTAVQALLQVEDLSVEFEVKSGLVDNLFSRRKKVLKAVDGVSFSINKGEILSLVGESGSGKTTTAKAILKLVPTSRGKVWFDGEEVGDSFQEKKAFRRRAQMIYQDPYQSLSPRNYIIDIVAEPLDVNDLVHTVEDRVARVKSALEQAGLCPAEDFFYRYPYELSGGQRQRVAIAGALVLEPEMIVADEPVSMLDASIRTGIIKLMVEMRDHKDIAYLFITHDLSLAWLISDKIAIMYLGKIMEIGASDQIIHDPRHPYTKALLDVMPKPGIKLTKKRNILKGETPSASEVIRGCKFNSRCPLAREICFQEQPPMQVVADGHQVACYFTQAGPMAENTGT
ncbi:MAG TPA: ABC transporter ATP-binding protein [Anaerolineales bacterium]|nr:ABC transporter ATP-binding protein [Anaerolineales bacterium]